MRILNKIKIIGRAVHPTMASKRNSLQSGSGEGMDNKNKDRKSVPTMYEIARLAGVSQSTVSRVLNGNVAVAPEKYAAVMEVVERLNYRPNIAAKGLAHGKTLTIGILARMLGSPFHGELLRGIEAGLHGSGYYPVIALGGDLANEDEAAIDMLMARQVDALIVLYSDQLSDTYLLEVAKELPLVIVGRQVPGLEQHCLCVNNRFGAYTATAYLISKGHTGIAHITGSLNAPDGAARREGYIQALIEHGLSVDPALIVEGDFGESSGVLGVNELLAVRSAHPFTAILVGNDQSAFGARLALYQRHIDVPNDISLIGFDDISGAQYMTPPLTTVRQPLYLMGMMAAKKVIAALAGEKAAMPDFPLELVIRQSVAIVGRPGSAASQRKKG